MARRDRVPRHKSHNHKRNKNAKLSPFQREQKRAKMANQVPTASTMGALDSVPHSQRHVFDFLQEKMRKQKEKRAALELARQQEQNAEEKPAGDTTVATSTGSSAASSKKKSDNNENSNTTATRETTDKKKNAKRAKMVFPSLNDELTASVGAALQPARKRASNDGDGDDGGDQRDPNAPRTVEEIIARKKERKHKRKQEARRARVAAELQEMEAELDDYVKNTNALGMKKKKKTQQSGGGQRGEDGEEKMSSRDKVNRAFERQLRTLNKEKEAQEAQRQQALVDAAAAAATRSGKQKENGARKRRRGEAATAADDEDHADEGSRNAASGAGAGGEDTEAPPRQRKRISFDPEVADPTAAQSARRAAKSKKPQDFYELVDVVRYGERVEAPPVFDVVPNRNAAVSRLANQLEREAAAQRPRRQVGGTEERHRLLSGAGQLGEQKRLARLGLAPAITHTIRPDASAAAASARLSKEEEIKALRDRVMATYQRNRRKEVTERKGVDMRHEFPKFA